MEKKAIFAGGCFWGLEELFRTQKGVLRTRVGYTGGINDHPTYEDHPGHAEAVLVTYDDSQTTYCALLDYFFRIHNPTTLNKQGNDRGTSYRSAIFYQTEHEKEESTHMINMVNASKRWQDPVVTEVCPFTTFWDAEEYHQNYLKKHPGGYTCHMVYFESYIK